MASTSAATVVSSSNVNRVFMSVPPSNLLALFTRDKTKVIKVSGTKFINGILRGLVEHKLTLSW